jgi:pantothenate kinase-related protein Tda10
MTAKTVPPTIIKRLLRRLVPIHDRVAVLGTGDEIHFSSSAGIDIKLKLDLAELLLLDGWYLGVEPEAMG